MVRRSPFFRFCANGRLSGSGGCDQQYSDAVVISKRAEIDLIDQGLSASISDRLVIDKQLAKAGTVYRRGQVVKLLETQIALVEAHEGIAVIPSFDMCACRNRKVTMSALIDPVVNLDFYQISNRGSRLSEGALEFSGFLKTYIANWAGTSSL